MKSEETFFKYPDFNNIKEIIYNSVEKYPNNIAFKIKEKNGKEVKYKEIKEKPDQECYDSIMNEMGKFLRTLSELERLLFHEDFIDERILNNEILEWRKFRMNIKERFL